MLIKKVATTIIWRTIADFVEDETQSKLKNYLAFTTKKTKKVRQVCRSGWRGIIYSQTSIKTFSPNIKLQQI